MTKSQFEIKSIFYAISIVAIWILFPYLIIAIVLVAGLMGLLTAIWRIRWPSKSIGTSNFTYLRMVALGLAYTSTLLVYSSHFHGHIRTQISGGCFKVTLAEENVWGNTPGWRFGPQSGAVWQNEPYFELSRPNGKTYCLFVGVPIWLPLSMACAEVILLVLCNKLRSRNSLPTNCSL